MNSAVALRATPVKNKKSKDKKLGEPKFDQVIINYDTHNLSKERKNWETMCIEDQRELLARGAVRFFKEEEEVPFYKALL
jgi:hypothetical protein